MHISCSGRMIGKLFLVWMLWVALSSPFLLLFDVGDIVSLSGCWSLVADYCLYSVLFIVIFDVSVDVYACSVFNWVAFIVVVRSL